MHLYPSGYSPASTPHLTPALELDTAIIEFSSKLEENGLPREVSSEKDINILIAELEKVVQGLHLWQYYVLDPDREKEAVKAALSSGKVQNWKVVDVKGKNVAELAVIFRASKKIRGLGELASRYGVHVDGGVAAGFIKAAFADSEVTDDEGLATAWQKVVDVLNVDLYKAWEDDTKIAIANVKNRVKYTRLDPHGPKLGVISKEYDFIPFSICSYSFTFLVFQKETPSLNRTSPALRLLPMQINSFILS